MIFRNLTAQQLEQCLLPYMNRPAWPGLDDPAVKHRAGDYARASGLWQQLGDKLDPVPGIPVLRHSDYLDYKRTGSRSRAEQGIRQRITQTDLAALALWLEHPAARMDYLEDLLWAWCESDWHIPAHEAQHIELVSSAVARMLAEYRWMFQARLDPSVCRRISGEIGRRILDVALDWRKHDWWNVTENNWNSVCNANLVQTALYEIHHARDLAAFVHPICRRMDYALAYFTSDGGCPEGCGYWEYGFGHFLDAALTIQHRTGGKILLADDEHIRRICRFPLAVQLRGPQRAAFADGGNGYLSPQTAMKVHRLYGIADLFQLVEPSTSGMLKLENVRTLALHEGQHPLPAPAQQDYFLPDLGYAKISWGKDLILAAIAGNNGVSHNHNDIGSFILMAGQTPFLTDPGSPVYSSKTFGPKRYEMLFCRSRGHSVPIINGREQPTGEQYYGRIEASGLNGAGNPRIKLDLSHAYDDPTLTSLIREFRAEDPTAIGLTDAYRFTKPPDSLEEAFVTFQPVKIEADRQAVTISDAARTLTLRASVPGHFRHEEIGPEAHEGRDTRPLHRVTFIPAQLAREMELGFSFRFV